jgi:hypothetical protein
LRKRRLDHRLLRPNRAGDAELEKIVVEPHIERPRISPDAAKLQRDCKFPQMLWQWHARPK